MFRQNGVGLRVVLKCTAQVLEGIQFDVLGAESVGQGEVEPGEVQQPVGLLGVECLGSADKLDVLVVSQTNNGISVPSSQWHHSSRACLTACNLWLPMS